MAKKKKIAPANIPVIYNLVPQLSSIKDINKHIRNDIFAQELYGMLCTNIFIYDLEPDTPWACTWKYATEIITNLRKNAGIETDFTNEKLDLSANNYIFWYKSNTSVINTYVKEQLSQLGWTVRSYDDDLKRPQNN